MALLSSLFSGISGLNANSNAISIIGDNIANINTMGFKTSSPIFQDLLAQSFNGAASASGSQIGVGTRMAGVRMLFSQGGLQASSLPTDLAINGPGFFMVKNDIDGINYFTRAGQFVIDKDGNMVDPAGLKLQGYQADSAGAITGEVGNINVSTITSAPTATSNVSFVGNLDPNALETQGDLGGFDEASPFETSHYSYGVTVYDSQGNDHLLQLCFVQTDENEWDVHVLAKTDELGIDPPSANDYTDISLLGTPPPDNQLTFDADGLVATLPGFSGTGGTPLTVDWAGGVTDGEVLFDLGTVDDRDGLSQNSGASNILAQTQDGYAAGTLMDFSIDQSGLITGIFSNGDSRALSKVLLAGFPNDMGLTKMGGNLYLKTPTSGDPVLGTADSPAMGTINAQYLEQSNVDLASEFVNLIMAQRAFQANSRIISTTDGLLNELVNLVR